MPVSAPLDRAILDAPDDDAPRLVWADREGGERGEFVVLQCALARRDAEGRRVLSDRAERRRLRAREQALFFRHVKAWTQPVRDFVSSEVRFERGFLVHARCWTRNVSKPGALRTLFDRAPLLSSLELWDSSGADDIEGSPREEVERWVLEALQSLFAQLEPGQPLRSLALSPSFSVDTFPNADGGVETHAYGQRVLPLVTAVPMLRAQLEHLTFAGDDVALNDFAPLQRLASLDVTAPASGAAFVECLRRLPLLRALHAPFDGSVRAALEAPEVTDRKLTQLRLGGVALSDDDLGALAQRPALGSLQELTLRLPSSPALGFEALLRSPHLSTLRALTLHHASDAVVAQLTNASFAHRLECLHLRDSKALTDHSVPTLVARFAALEDLLVLGSGLSSNAAAVLREAMPPVLV